MSDKKYTEEEMKNIVANVTLDIINKMRENSSYYLISAKDYSLRFLIEKEADKESNKSASLRAYSAYQAINDQIKDINEKKRFLYAEKFLKSN